MPLPYLGALLLSWLILVGGTSSALVHEENNRVVQASVISVNPEAQVTGPSARGTVGIK